MTPDLLKETVIFLDSHKLTRGEIKDSDYLDSLLYNFLEYYDTSLVENDFQAVISNYQSIKLK